MYRSGKVVVSVALLFFMPIAANAAHKGVSAVVTYTKGKVQVMASGTKTWNNANMGQFIYEGDTVRTGPASRAGLTYTGAIETRLNANTTIKVEPAELANKGEGDKIQMLFGKVWTKILKKRTKFQIYTPVAVCSVRGTEYETDVEKDGRTDVKVYEGEVELFNNYGSKKVNKNSKSSVGAGSPPSDPVPLGGGEKETWQEEMNTKGSLKLDLGNKEVAAGRTLEATVTVLDKKGNKDEKYAKKITISSDNNDIAFALGGSDDWSSKQESVPAAGGLVFRIKALKDGSSGANISVSAEDLGVTMGKIDIKRVPVKNLKVKIKTADGKEKELLLKFKPK